MGIRRSVWCNTITDGLSPCGVILNTVVNKDNTSTTGADPGPCEGTGKVSPQLWSMTYLGSIITSLYAKGYAPSKQFVNEKTGICNNDALTNYL